MKIKITSVISASAVLTNKRNVFGGEGVGCNSTCISKYKKKMYLQNKKRTEKTLYYVIQLYIKKIFPKKNEHFIDSAVAQY